MTTQSTEPGPQWLTVAEVAVRLRIERRTVYRAIRAGRLKAAAVNRRGLRIARVWVDEYAESCASALAR